MTRAIKALKIHLPILVKSEAARIFPFVYSMLNFQRHLAIIILTHRCNLKCIMCKQPPAQSSQELDGQRWKAIFAQLRQSGISELHFTGGEPLLRPDLPELVKHAVNLNLKVGIGTNGCLLTSRLLSQLVASGVYSIGVSVDAIGKNYDQIRGVENSNHKIKQALEILAESKKNKRLKVYINFTLSRQTLEHFYNVKQMADSLNLPVAICLLDDTPYFFNLDRNRSELWLGAESADEFDKFINFLKQEKIRKPRSLIISPAAIDYISRYFYDSRQKKIPCIVSQTRIFIEPDGVVRGGCLSQSPLGDLNKASLETIMNQPDFRRLQRNMFYKKCPGCSCGYLYNVQHHLPSVLIDIFK